jgi:copper(I)-binding protein
MARLLNGSAVAGIVEIHERGGNVMRMRAVPEIEYAAGR